MSHDSDAKARASESWFGYGRWDAPYWFIGKEPGGADDPEQYESWLRLGATELIDCRAHDLDCSETDERGLWHGGERPALQATWRPLIAMLLAYEGASAYDQEAVRHYQDERWGRLDGDTAVLELSAVAAPSVSGEQAMRLLHLPERKAAFRRHLALTPPKFVVFYGLGNDPVHGVPYLDHWRAIAQYDLIIGEPVMVGETVFVVEPHPTAHGSTNEHWTDLGRRVRALTENAIDARIPNQNLSSTELRDLFMPLITDLRARLAQLAGGDADLHWALRRKLAKELTYDERSKPMQRRALKKRKRQAQGGVCAVCRAPLPERGAVLDRLSAMKGYTDENTRLICSACDTNIQAKRGYA